MNSHLSQLIFSDQIWDPQDSTFLKTRSKIHRILQKAVWTRSKIQWILNQNANPGSRIRQDPGSWILDLPWILAHV